MNVYVKLLDYFNIHLFIITCIYNYNALIMQYIMCDLFLGNLLLFKGKYVKHSVSLITLRSLADN
jgi:hypothetical protein